MPDEIVHDLDADRVAGRGDGEHVGHGEVRGQRRRQAVGNEVLGLTAQRRTGRDVLEAAAGRRVAAARCCVAPVADRQIADFAAPALCRPLSR